MSELKHMLDIVPDRYGTRTEKEYIRNVRCPRCHGNGGFREEKGRDQYVFVPCGLCDGTKKVKATITVEWEADYES